MLGCHVLVLVWTGEPSTIEIMLALDDAKRLCQHLLTNQDVKGAIVFVAFDRMAVRMVQAENLVLLVAFDFLEFKETSLV